MRFGSRIGMVAVIAASLVATPVAAQDGHVVWYDGVGFAFASSLGQSVNIAQVRATTGGELGVPDPVHVSFTLYGTREAYARPPAIGGPIDAPREVRIYRTADLAATDGVDSELASLQQVLETRPDPASFSTVSGPLEIQLPSVPTMVGAARIVQARVHYIDTPELSGIAYVASYAQDFLPPTSKDLEWTFQGLSADGSTYVSVRWGLTTDLLPSKLPKSIYAQIERDWAKVLGDTTTTIEDASPDAFTPDLDTLDALVRSMVLPGGPASQAPEASPAA